MRRELILFFMATVGIVCVTSNCSVAGSEICVDLYTQYLSPWGGQGLHMASDAFPPDGVVVLRTSVTFQGDGVPYEPVSYTIEAPNGEVCSATSFTQADGIAVLEYSLPGSEDYFGHWTVKASVDFGGTTVSDTLYFLMGWLVEVVNVEAPETTYKGETMGVNVTLSRICMQDPRDMMNMLLKDSDGNPITDNDLLLYITVTDELNQPVATFELNTSIITELRVYDLDDFVETIGGEWMDHIAIISTQYPLLESAVMNGILISPWSFSGKATIHANLITDYPGVPYCPEGLGHVWIRSRDCIANVLDISVVAKAYGSKYNETDGLFWHDPPCKYCPHDPLCDINRDDVIDILDIAMVAKDYGKNV